MRKLIYISLIFLLVPFSVKAQEKSEGKLRIGLREFKGVNMNPMEKFLLENEIVNILINNNDAEVIGEVIIKEKLTSLGVAICDTDECRSVLTEALNLDYLIWGSIRQLDEGAFNLTMRLYQRETAFSFILTSRANSFTDIKKSLDVVSQIIKSIAFQKEEVTKKVRRAEGVSQLNKNKDEITKDIRLLDLQINKTRNDVRLTERRIKQIQRRFKRLIEKNPELEEIYLKILNIGGEEAPATEQTGEGEVSDEKQ